MKNLTRIIGIVVLAAIIGFAFAACEGPMGPQGEQGIQGEKGKGGTVGTYYTVTFDANGGTGSVPDPQNVEAGYAMPILPAGDLEKDGSMIYGWDSKPDGTGTDFFLLDDDIFYYTPTANVTFYAVYPINHIPVDTGLRGILWKWVGGYYDYCVKISDDGATLLSGSDRNSLGFTENIQMYTRIGSKHIFQTDNSYIYTVNADLTELSYRDNNNQSFPFERVNE